ncbi:hypothetical protein [Halalkaliarchaeum desulfuricum]|uniref:hypothetical protein n=1 Tax=Halalkaliarchaeum desulfuricum TaxID=2055893 RepID=UPI000E6C60BC|nr:hypothetical protein [Halalkaliarchaeum desulfuricum]
MLVFDKSAPLGGPTATPTWSDQLERTRNPDRGRYEGDWDDGDSITITHAAGDEIRADRIEIEIQGAETIHGEEVFAPTS